MKSITNILYYIYPCPVSEEPKESHFGGVWRSDPATRSSMIFYIVVYVFLLLTGQPYGVHITSGNVSESDKKASDHGGKVCQISVHSLFKTASVRQNDLGQNGVKDGIRQNTKNN